MFKCETNVPPQPYQGWSSQILDAKNVVVVPPQNSGLIVKAGVLDSRGRDCKRAALWRGGRRITTKPDAPESVETRLPGKWLWGGVLCGHFGHFLVESTGRIWGADFAGDDARGIIFIPRRPREAAKITAFQREFLNLSGIELPIKLITAPTEVEKLIVPGQGFGLGRISAGTIPFRRHIQNRFGRSVPADGAKKLYISRSKLGLGKGALIGEKQLEEHLEAEGYKIFHPQDHGISAQIAQYKAADHVIAAEGSALHLFAMVGRARQKVAIVLRRRSGATGYIETHLRNFCHVEPLTLDCLRSTWKPVNGGKKKNWLGELDLGALQHALAEGGFVSDTAAPWQNVSKRTVERFVGKKFVQVQGPTEVAPMEPALQEAA